MAAPGASTWVLAHAGPARHAATRSEGRLSGVVAEFMSAGHLLSSAGGSFSARQRRKMGVAILQRL